MAEREIIIAAIIRKGGLMSRVAEMYKDDNTLTDQFIWECYSQCHIPEVKGFLGSELVSRINEYTKQSILLA